MYTVKDNEVKLRFTLFKDVIEWAWNTHKIDILDNRRQLVFEDEQQQACDELSEMLKKGVQHV